MEHIDDSQAHGEALEQQMNILGVSTRAVERSLRWWRGIVCMGLLVTLAMVAHPPSVLAIDVRSGPGFTYEMIAQVASGENIVVVAQEQDWYKIQLPDRRQGWIHRFYMGQPGSAQEQRPFQKTAPVVTPPPATPSPVVTTPPATPSPVVTTPPIAAPTGLAIDVRSGPGFTYEMIAQVASGENIVVVAQEQDWYKIRLPDRRQGWIHRFYTGQPGSVPDKAPEKFKLIVRAVPVDSIVKLKKMKTEGTGSVGWEYVFPSQ